MNDEVHVAALFDGTFVIDTRTVPLTDVERAWTDDIHPGERVVITPSSSLVVIPQSRWSGDPANLDGDDT